MQGSTMERDETPVGVTIAYKRKKEGFRTPPKKTPQNDKDSSPSSPTTASNPSSFRVLLEGATLYLACLVVPTMIGYLVRLYDEGQGRTTTNLPAAEDESWSLYAYHQAAYYVCPTRPSSSSWTMQTWSYYVCPPETDSTIGATARTSVLSSDTDWSDFGRVSLMAMLLAIIRIVIVNLLVPIQDSERLEALVRCKSVHLLSSDYSASLTPSQGTPVLPAKPTLAVIPPQDHPNMSENLMIPSFEINDDDDNNLGLGIDESERSINKRLFPQQKQQQQQLQQQQQQEELLRQEEEELLQQQEEQEELLRQEEDHEAAFVEQVAAQMTSTHEPSSSSSSKTSTRMYAAPRYATAIFRLGYCTVAASLALYYFRDANFWPWYVGGTGSTRHCWDLSGGLTVGMDSDFDHHNNVLKRYFLWQASYHWHSAAFHILSMLILVLHPKHAPRRFLSVQTSTFAYIRSLAIHVTAVVLIGTAFVFSSLRRLCAIGMFAFDLSSWFLHLLQICINAPDGSRWKQANVVARIHVFLVIPSFAWTRFVVWPALWYSAAVESKQWLEQLEKTIVPGSALVIKIVLNVIMLIIMSLTVIYFQRLLHHPHLQRILRTKRAD